MNNNFLLLDSGNGFKLEQVGEFRLVRPAPNAFWEPSLPLKEWENIHGRYERSSKGGGHWTWFNGGVKDSWNIQWGGFTFLVKPTNFGHLGFFAEQHENWKWLKQIISSSDNIVIPEPVLWQWLPPVRTFAIWMPLRV
jgi:23S rRNA (cytosine1962-C5)-methyltransferase